MLFKVHALLYQGCYSHACNSNFSYVSIQLNYVWQMSIYIFSIISYVVGCKVNLLTYHVFIYVITLNQISCLEMRLCVFYSKAMLVSKTYDVHVCNSVLIPLKQIVGRQLDWFTFHYCPYKGSNKLNLRFVPYNRPVKNRLCALITRIQV